MKKSEQMVRVRWSNNRIDAAPTWEELEKRVRVDQWGEFTEEEFRAVMAKRAWRWSRTDIDTDGSSELFFRELERAGLVLVETDGEES